MTTPYCKRTSTDDWLFDISGSDTSDTIVINFIGSINNDLAINFTATVRCIMCHQPQVHNVYIHIDSHGGGSSAVHKVIDMFDGLRHSGRLKRVVTIMTGYCASAGVMLALGAATLGDVVATENAFIFTHEPFFNSGEQKVTEASLLFNLKRFKLYNQFDNEIYMRNLALQKTKVLVNGDCWWTAKEALEVGLINRVSNIIDKY
ncbi:MAG: hypothetical protein Faunusvirus20_11 [Faunusvirus sp.]|jgi:ATP-dependent protease ClpP protease subunit|uniref:Clp protease n=1 Tax=Faunusvirus sp. TaxID=2487766 RepID=A0A3G4ZX87_9VIRU|nr:MAG: hypothetical protein Faunusvirus20_11 [Faunusvirus sp.]